MFLVVWSQLRLLSSPQFDPARLSILLQVVGLCWGASSVPLTPCVSLLFSCMIFLLPPCSFAAQICDLPFFEYPLGGYSSQNCTANPCCNWSRELDMFGTSWVQSSVCCLFCLCCLLPSLFNALIPKNRQQNFSQFLYVCFRWMQGSNAVLPEWARPNKPIAIVTPMWRFLLIFMHGHCSLHGGTEVQRWWRRAFHVSSSQCLHGLFTHVL